MTKGSRLSIYLFGLGIYCFLGFWFWAIGGGYVADASIGENIMTLLYIVFLWPIAVFGKILF